MEQVLSTKWLSDCHRYTVTIDKKCLGKMLRIASLSHPAEIGGALIGRYTDDGFDAFIISATRPPGDSYSQRSTFIRGARGLAKFFLRLYDKFAFGLHYVGEWHSHPCGLPNPSGIDDESLMRISRYDKANCSEPILIIVGGSPNMGRKLGVYVYSRARGRIRLTPTGDDI